MVQSANLQLVGAQAIGRSFWRTESSTKMSVDTAYAVSAQVASMGSRYNA